jgi:hypothetical protein
MNYHGVIFDYEDVDDPGGMGVDGATGVDGAAGVDAGVDGVAEAVGVDEDAGGVVFDMGVGASGFVFTVAGLAGASTFLTG